MHFVQFEAHEECLVIHDDYVRDKLKSNHSNVITTKKKGHVKSNCYKL